MRYRSLARRVGRVLLGLSCLLGRGLPAQPAAPAPLRLSAFLLAVPPERNLMLRLRRFEAATGYAPVDSLRLRADGPLTLTDDAPTARPLRAGLYELALDRYSRVEVILAPGEVPHCAAAVPQLARAGVYWEQSAENLAYQQTMALVLRYDTLLSRACTRLQQLPDSAQAARAAATHALERLHRDFTRQLAAAAPAGTFAAKVVARLLRFPLRPEAQAFAPGYLAWLGPALANDFPLGSDEALRHYAGHARLAQLVWQLGPVLPGGPAACAARLLARRQGHDAVNAWLWTQLTREALARDDPDFMARLALDEGAADACRPALPPALAAQLAAAQSLLPGQPAPALTQADTLGQPHALLTEARRHQYTLLYAWVSWCHTCEAETPQLRQLLARLGPRRLGVYAAGLDEHRAAWVTALRQHRPAPAGWLDVAALVPISQNAAVQHYHVRLTPKLVLLDQQGRIVGRYRSVAELAAAPQLAEPATGQ